MSTEPTEKEVATAEPSTKKKIAMAATNMAVTVIVSIVAGVVTEVATKQVSKLVFHENG